jgi:CheY-like chemotaxis protein
MNEFNPETSSDTILVAEDEPGDLLYIQDLFERARIRNPIQVVGDGQATINYLEADGIYTVRELYPFPVLLMLDLVMPKKSGWEVLSWMATRPQKLPLDVVVVSNATDFESQRMAFECGARSFLSKPFGLESLVNLFNALSYAHVESRADGYELRHSEYRPIAWFV